MNNEIQPIANPVIMADTQNRSSEERNALYIVIALLISAVPSVGIFLYYGALVNSWQVRAIAFVILAASVIAFFTLFLIRRGKHIQAMTIVLVNVTITFLAVPFLVEGLGIISALSLALFIVAITSLAMSPRYIFPGLVAAILIGLVVFFLDTSLQNDRFTVPQQIQATTPYITLGLLIFFIVITAGQFNRYTLRIKIIIGILVTSSIIIVALTIFGAVQIREIIALLTQRYEEESRARIEESIVSSVSSEAEIVNGLFEKIQSDMTSLAGERANLEQQRAVLGLGTYWDPITRIFQLSGGQYGNASTDPSAIFIPSTVTITETLLADLSTTAYLDFSAPAFLSNHPEVASVYYINKAGATTYYPNINLAQNVNPNFDPRNESFYTIAEPQNNPNREPKWTDVYVDPAGQGLVVTLSVPVYSGNTFLGVMSADIELSKIAERVSNIKPGDTGYAFLVDSSGHIIAMPDQGYQLYEIQPEVIESSQSPRQSILVKGAFDLQEATSRIINGESAVTTIQVKDESTYIAFSTLKTPNYRLAVVVPESEFTSEIIEANAETNFTLERIQRNSAIILAILFLIALLISLWVGQLITAPLTRLTKTVDTISEGDLSARATITTEDETGRLAFAFNTMAERLSNTLLGLERRITERTNELETANKSNERRASQFESVARVAQLIGTTESSEDLLSRIVEVISQQFNFYHTGIFLLDLRKEYAILTASNSEGGRKMLARNHRLPVNESSIVGFVSKNGRPRLALDTSTDSNYSTNPDLSRTRSEMALPLMVGNEVIGVLDVQSHEKDAFSNEDFNAMSTLARQVSIAIQNARSYQQTREALQRAENSSMELSRQNWKQFANQKQIDNVLFDGINTKTVSKAGEQKPHNLAIPLMLRGTKIGSIKLSSIDPLRVWNEDELALLQAAADRTTLAIENARLLQEAQKRAAKERTIGEISSKIGGLVNIENILETAIKELGTNFSDTNIAIQFAQEDSEQNS